MARSRRPRGQRAGSLTGSTRLVRHGVGAAVLGILVTVSTTSGAAFAGSIPPAKGMPSFYSVPSPLPKGPPGTLVKWQQVHDQGVDGTTYRVMYLSESETGKPVAVTGIVMVPRSAPPPGGYPVVSWGHGTNGMADQCAPSLQSATAVPLVNDLLQQGWEVTASDYQGEGTPGLLPYLVGKLAAQNTIDIVRAAGHLAGAHASANYVVWGHSEGGQTAMFALHIGPTYAPDLHMKGVVAGAPPSQFAYIYAFLRTSPYRYYLFMAAKGFNVGYGNNAAPLQEVLTPLAMSKLPILSMGCADYVASIVDRYSLAQAVKSNPFDVPKWRALITANDPENFSAASPVPLLIIQGGADEQIPVVSTQLLAQHLCSLHQTVQRWIYPGQSHAGVIAPSMADMVHWIGDRLANQSAPDPYKPTGMPGVETSSC